jgi:hypothetical protein
MFSWVVDAVIMDGEIMKEAMEKPISVL